LAFAHGDVTRPAALGFDVAALPRQGYTASWTVICRRAGRIESRSGHFSGVSVIDLLAPHVVPLPVAHLERCWFAVGAHLDHGGRILLVIMTR
jgi:hypothetical protein